MLTEEAVVLSKMKHELMLTAMMTTEPMMTGLTLTKTPLSMELKEL